MDWASMVMQMYKSWAQRRGYKVTVVEEMPGEIAGIKVLLLTIINEFLNMFLFLVLNSIACTNILQLLLCNLYLSLNQDSL